MRAAVRTTAVVLPSFHDTAHSDARARALMARLGWKELGARFYRAPRRVRRSLPRSGCDTDSR